VPKPQPPWQTQSSDVQLLVSSWQTDSLKAASSKTILRLPLCHPFSSCSPRFWLELPIKTDNSAPRFHLVPPVQFQVLLTRLSTFFSTFLRSTFPLSVFVLYLDLAEVYQLLCAEITINATLKVELIWTRILTMARGLSPSLVQLSYWLSTIISPPGSTSKGASLKAIYIAPSLFLWSLHSSFATTRCITFVFFSTA